MIPGEEHIQTRLRSVINQFPGQTLQGVWLEEPAFTYGQLYVAASSVGSLTYLNMAIKNSLPTMVKNEEPEHYNEILG